MRLRRRFPRWGKDKLIALLRRKGLPLSTSVVKRILRELKQRGVLVEPLGSGLRSQARAPTAPLRGAKTQGYRAIQPGDLVQVDTLDSRPLPGVG